MDNSKLIAEINDMIVKANSQWKAIADIDERDTYERYDRLRKLMRNEFGETLGINGDVDRIGEHYRLDSKVRNLDRTAIRNILDEIEELLPVLDDDIAESIRGNVSAIRSDIIS